MQRVPKITCSEQPAQLSFSSTGQIRARRPEPPDGTLIHLRPSRYGVKHTLSVVTFLGMIALLVQGAWAPKAEAVAAPTLADLQSTYPELAGVVRAIEYVPCAQLFNNRTRPDCATTTGPKAEAEAHFDTMTIWVANDIQVSSWVLRHEACHLLMWSRFGDPSEAGAAQCEAGRR